MEKDIQTLAKNFMEKGYEVYLRGKGEDLKKLFNKDQPLGILLAETSKRIENLEKLEALGEQKHNDRAIKDELKELKAIKSNFETLRDDLDDKDITPREAINEFLGKEGSEGNRTFADLIKGLVYKLFPSKYEEDKKKVADGITADLAKIQEAQSSLNKEVKILQSKYEEDKKKVADGITADLTKLQEAQSSLNKEVKILQSQYLDNPADKVREMLVARIDTLSEIKENLVKVFVTRPDAEIEPSGKAFDNKSLKPNYQKMSNDNIGVMQEILQINQEIAELQKVSYRFAKLEDRLTNKEKPADELYDELKSKLAQTKTENVVVQKVSTLLADLSEGKNVNVLHGFKQLQESQIDLQQKAVGLKESSKSITKEIERTSRKESTRHKSADYGGVDKIFSKLQDGTAFKEMRTTLNKHRASKSHNPPDVKAVTPKVKDRSPRER